MKQLHSRSITSNSSHSSSRAFLSPTDQQKKEGTMVRETSHEKFGFHALLELPHEMMYSIFNFLSVRECCNNVSAVNRWFKSMIDKYLSSGQVRELNICKEVYHCSYMREKEGLITSEELFNFYFRTKEEMDRMKHFRSCFMKLLTRGVHRLIFEKLKDFPLGLLYCDKMSEKLKPCKGNKKVVKQSSSTRQQCLFNDCETFWNSVKFLNIDSSTFCNFPRMGSNFEDDGNDVEQVTGLQLLCKIAPLLKNLESLSLKNLRLITDEDFEFMRIFLLTILKNGGNLKTLILQNTGLFESNDWDGMYGNCSHLEHLTIHEKHSPYTSFILKLTHLKFLDLFHVKDVNMALLFERLPIMEHVSIRHSTLCGFDCATLIDCSCIASRLKSLDIQQCSIYSEGNSADTSLIVPSTMTCTLLDLISFKYLEKFVFTQISYMDEMKDFRDSQTLFDSAIERLNSDHMHVLCLDGLTNIKSLDMLFKFRNLETLHLHGTSLNHLSLLRILVHFPKLQNYSVDGLDITGKEFDQFLLHELASYDCSRTLRSLNIERWSTYDPLPQTCQTFHAFQFDSIPTLPKLEYLKLVGFCVGNERVYLNSNQELGDLKQRIHVKCPLLSTFIVSSVSNDRSNFKYLKPSNSTTLQTESFEQVSITYPLLHFEFWKNSQVTANVQHRAHSNGSRSGKKKQQHQSFVPGFNKGRKKKY
ncbi:hypothetical protein C9374_011019 [Naegleria lovaniensis]|uniref:F-box domain-containing protein n=1 Tax=Naegleria lovaniensis TaxID=51637 RepID=A0AA88KIR2_NAELO|nr:uncharacterized protein C9374_011019 [Naegleria lovaniensis]KAG2374182.1 hypothetical protein C9374_011019 [Naegleria lovaniensis]